MEVLGLPVVVARVVDVVADGGDHHAELVQAAHAAAHATHLRYTVHQEGSVIKVGLVQAAQATASCRRRTVSIM